jgi:hypothetical protein
MKRLLTFDNNRCFVYSVHGPNDTWEDGFTFYGIFFHEIFRDVEVVFGIHMTY